MILNVIEMRQTRLLDGGQLKLSGRIQAILLARRRVPRSRVGSGCYGSLSLKVPVDQVIGMVAIAHLTTP